nr:MAG TPA: hypothetical protein [Caudoviricetes sp.]
MTFRSLLKTEHFQMLQIHITMLRLNSLIIC